MYTTIIISDRPITVKYSFIGKDYPATREKPAERPEMIFEAFYEGDTDVTDLIIRYCNSEILQNIETQILEKI